MTASPQVYEAFSVRFNTHIIYIYIYIYICIYMYIYTHIYSDNDSLTFSARKGHASALSLAPAFVVASALVCVAPHHRAMHVGT
jgi:hypothetical protein